MRLIAHSDGRELRGSERQLTHLALGLRSRGHEVTVSCRERAPLAETLAEGGVPVTGVRPSGDLDLPSALAFRRLLVRARPDCVLLTSWKRVFVGSWAARSAGVPRVVVRLGIVRALPPRGTAAWKLERAFTRQVDALIVNSDDVARSWLQSAPWFPASRLHVIPNGVVQPAGDPDRLRAELGIDPRIRLVGAVGALERRKGFDLLVRALAHLPEDVQAVVAGDGPEAGALRALAVELGASGRVHWLGTRRDVGNVLAASQAFVQPSRQDSTANAMLEAMSLGVAVVATAGNGSEEALGAREGRAPAGWIVPAEDPAALAAAIVEALRAGDAPRGREAAWRARMWFSVERMVEQYERVLFPAPGARVPGSAT